MREKSPTVMAVKDVIVNKDHVSSSGSELGLWNTLVVSMAIVSCAILLPSREHEGGKCCVCMIA